MLMDKEKMIASLKLGDISCLFSGPSFSYFTAMSLFEDMDLAEKREIAKKIKSQLKPKLLLEEYIYFIYNLEEYNEELLNVLKDLHSIGLLKPFIIHYLVFESANSKSVVEMTMLGLCEHEAIFGEMIASSKYKDMCRNFFDKTSKIFYQANYLKVLADIDPKTSMGLFISKNLIKNFSPEELSSLYVAYIKNGFENEKTKWLLDFICSNFEHNDVGKLLCAINKQECAQNLLDNLELLVLKSKDFFYHLVRRFPKESRLILASKAPNFLKFLDIAINPNNSTYIRNGNTISYIVGEMGLGYFDNVLQEIFMESSFFEIRQFADGKRADVYLMENLVFKFSKEKFNKEILPRDFTLIKDYEVIYVRNSTGKIIAALEVQPYAYPIDPRNSKHRDMRSKILAHLANKGIYYHDDGEQNFGILPDYHLMDCDDPELIPEEFKEIPMVIIDKDGYALSDDLKTELAKEMEEHFNR